jgi:hypothetical protein
VVFDKSDAIWLICVFDSTAYVFPKIELLIVIKSLAKVLAWVLIWGPMKILPKLPRIGELFTIPSVWLVIYRAVLPKLVAFW